MIKTLPFSAKKKCIIKMGPRQVTVNSACLCPYTETLRVITVGDIVKCLSAGATVLEFTRESKNIADIKTLDIKNATYVFDEEHLEYLKKFNSDIRTPVMQRDSYLIDIPEAPKKTEIPETPVATPEEPKVEEPTVTEEPQVAEETVVEEPKEEVKVEDTVEVTEEVTIEATTEEEAPAEETTEEVEESTEEEQPKYYNNNRKNRNRR